VGLLLAPATFSCVCFGNKDNHPRVMINPRLLEQAQQKVPNTELLINIITRRVRQLAQGHRPLVQPEPRMEFADIALKEIVDGKLSWEVDETPVPEIVEDPADTKL